VLALILLLQADPAEAFFGRVTIENYRPLGPVQDQVIRRIRDKDQWIQAYRAVEAALGPMPADAAVNVGFDFRGDQLAKARGPAKTGEIRFNVDRLEEAQTRLNELEALRVEYEKKKLKMVFKVPPARLDRVLWHELTHIWQDGLEAPEWFLEGMAQYVAQDESLVGAFARSGRDLPSLDGPWRDTGDAYVRGQLFWSWLHSRGAVKAVAKAFAKDRKPWKAAVEESLKLSWDLVVVTERAWTAAELERIRERVR
jgi:hypothetical protein